MFQCVLYASFLLGCGLSAGFGHGDVALAVAEEREIFLERIELRPEVEVMQESIAFVSDTHKTSVQSGHELTDFGQIDVAHRKLLRAPFLLVLHEALVLEQGDGDVLRLHIYNQFACHKLVINSE